MPVMAKIHTKLETLFKQGIEKGIFKDLDPYVLGASFNGISSVFIFHMLHFPEKFSYFDNIDTMMEMFFDNILVNDSAERT